MNYKNQLRNLTLIAAAAVFSFTSCKKEDDDVNNNGNDPYENGVFITSEGPFQTGSGTVAFYNRNTESAQTEIFKAKNNRPLGNIVQSITVYDGKAYIVVNNAGKVEVANAGDFSEFGVVDNLSSPRYFVGSGTNGYISDWADGVYVVNLNSLNISATVNTGGTGADQMAIASGKLYVLNSGGFAQDSTMAVINTNSNTLEQTLVVGDLPNSLQLDANDKLWVLCGGIADWSNPSNDTKGNLLRIDPATANIELNLEFPSAASHPSKLSINGSGDKLYYQYNNAIYEMGVSASALPASPVINRSFYHLDVDPVSGELFATNAVDFVQKGYVVRYNLNSYAKVDSFQAGVIPGGFAFE